MCLETPVTDQGPTGLGTILTQNVKRSIRRGVKVMDHDHSSKAMRGGSTELLPPNASARFALEIPDGGL